jgi:hypothetical protein
MIKIYVWDRSLPNNYHSAESPIGLELSASAVVMAPSRKEAIALVERQINPKDRIGPSAHYVRNTDNNARSGSCFADSVPVDRRALQRHEAAEKSPQ